MKLVQLGMFLCLATTSWQFLPSYRWKLAARTLSPYLTLKAYLTTDGTIVTHKEMTETALVHVAKEFLKKKDPHDPTKYDGVTNLDTIMKLAYGPSAVSDYFRSTVTAIQNANVNVDFDMDDVSAAHFDAENIYEGNEQLLVHFDSAVGYIENGSYDKAHESIGRLLHGLQDFYSHTNWIEMKTIDPNRHLDIEPDRRLATKKHPKIMPEDVAPDLSPTCVKCADFWDSVLNPSNTLFKCNNNIKIENPDHSAFASLTSGYYRGQDRSKPRASSLFGGGADGSGKCSHGGALDTTSLYAARGGINKDSNLYYLSPHYYLHSIAAEVATAASINVLTELGDTVDIDHFLSFLGLYRGYSFTIILDTTISMMEEISSVRQEFGRISKANHDKSTVQPDEYVLVPFNQACAGPVYRFYSSDDFDEKLESVSRQLANQVGCIGGQTRLSNLQPGEKAISGLILALRTSRPGSTVYVFTDSATDKVDAGKYPEASVLIERKRITVFFIRSKDNSSPGNSRRRRRNAAADKENVFAKLAEESGGQVLVAKDDSDVGDLLSLTSSLSKPSDSTLLIYEEKSSTGLRGRNLTLNIDELVTSLTVSLSGENPKIILYGPQGQVVDPDPTSTTQSLTAISKVTSPSSGTWTINVYSTDEFDVLIKGASSLDFQYTLVKPMETNHPGLFTIPEKPKIGDTVYIELTVTGLTNETSVSEVRLLTTDHQVKENCSIVAVTNDTASSYMTETNVTILEDPFLILLVGHYGEREFTRVASTPIMPVALELTLQSGDLVLRQGKTVTWTFLVERGNIGGDSLAEIAVQNDLGLAVSVRGQKFSIGSGETRTFDVDVTVPVCYPESAVDVFIVTATLSLGDDERIVDSLLLNVLVDSEFVDNEPPVCFLNTIGTAGCSKASLNDCNQREYWSATLSVIDTASSIVVAGVTDPMFNGPNQPPSDSHPVLFSFPSLPLARNEFSFVNITALCCTQFVTLRFRDDSGNGVLFTAHRTDVPKSCSVVCKNGGKCDSKMRKCQCIGGYVGNGCENAGCNKLLSPPANGFFSATTQTINSSVNIGCNEGYVHAGKMSSTCCPFGWTDSSATCFRRHGTGRGHSASATVALIFALAATAFLSNMRGNFV